MNLWRKAGSVPALAVFLLATAGCTNDEPGETATPSGEFRLAERPGQPAVVDGVVYIGTASGRLYAVDMASNRELWRFDSDGAVFHAPVVAGDVLLFGSQDGQLRAVEKSSGRLLWLFAAGDVDWAVRDIFLNGTPAVVDGVAYVSSEDFNVYAIDVATGRERWRHTLGEEPQAISIPIVDRTAYIGAWDGYLYAIDIDTGERVWRSQTDDSERAALPNQVPHVTVVPIVTGEAVYFADWAGNLFAVERATGKQIWRFDPGTIDARHAGSRSVIAMEGDVIYYSTVEDRRLYGVDRHSGKATWSVQTEGIPYGPGAAGGGVGFYLEVLPGAAGGEPAMRLRALDFVSHEILWSAADIGGPPAAIDAVIYYGTTDGAIVGRDRRSGETVYRSGATDP